MAVDIAMTAAAVPVGKVGPKQVAHGERAVCASQHPIVTDTMLQVMNDGGNAVDAAIAGCLVQAVIQHEMTNYGGTVSFLYYEAKTGQTYQLNGTGTLVPGLVPFRQIPPGTDTLYARPGTPGPMGCMPGFMPSMKAMFERFATKPWAYLCQSAEKWAEEGHVVGSFEFYVLADTAPFALYTRSGREHYTLNGFLPQVGERFKKPALAKTVRSLSAEGPDYFITGEWAKHFVERANSLGWPIKVSDLGAVPPRWVKPLRFEHRGYEIVQLAPPERQAVYCALVLGILDYLDVQSMGHYSESAEALYFMAHALRRASWEMSLLNDPLLFEDPSAIWLSKEYQRLLGDILKNSKPRIDLTEHTRLNWNPSALAAAGAPVSGRIDNPTGSCELSIVDPEGNWVQMMNTLQSGGLPGEVVDGVPMVGSHAMQNMSSNIRGWLTGGGRITAMLGNTFVMKDGKPWLSLGSPGNVHCTVPQVLSNILDYEMEPYHAIDVPRLQPLDEDYTLGVESRLPESVVTGMAQLGILVKPLPKYDYHMGSFQMSWRDAQTGMLQSTADPRRAGKADGF